MEDPHRPTAAPLVHSPNLSDSGSSGVPYRILSSIAMWVLPIGWVLVAASARRLKKNFQRTMSRPINKVPAGSFISREARRPKFTDDYQYSLELQIQEVLLASLSSPSSPSTSIASSSNQSGGTLTTGPRLVNLAREMANPTIVSCEICMEDKRSWEIFKSDCQCHHSFCNECISRHMVAKIEENLDVIRCPAEDCKKAIDFSTCRSMIPRDTLVKWDEFLCQSVIPNAQKLFCPYRNCSAMLIDDSEETIREIICPVCHRLFCAACRVPWHSDFTCKEFQKLNSKKGGNGDKLLKLLAKKKNWQKCPSCKVQVEKTEGCSHMTCRCKHEFCYRCGSKWGESHRCKKS